MSQFFGGDDMENKVQTDRIFLREMKFEDWVDVHSYASIENACQFQPWGPNTVEESKEFVSQVLKDASARPRTRFSYAVVLKETGELIGCGEINIRDRTNRSGEIGYIIHPKHWSRGYATEVAELLIDFGFEKLRLHRVYATCDPRNIGSKKVLEKSSMRKEGQIRDHLWIKNKWRDSLLYSILEHENRARV